ncbi:LapB repeat-containing protein [Culicoidibacter larvae]|uniref:LPXTG cell wall anchor domain-containing protein n=1 Tax=Culicoidibacter larvae TaxID=2579976 RepID=A0A5R8QBY6_9FIRM|nr:LapB repeat-containing protein [Culicoidibacter larvae]TLG73776.1 LPXTG cell wall anchor domain-containing protein [Culicoidibacter larvae]
MRLKKIMMVVLLSIISLTTAVAIIDSNAISVAATHVDGVGPFTKIASGDLNAIGLRTNGTVMVSGYNQYGQLGTGNVTRQNKFVTIDTSFIPDTIVDVVSGEHTSALITANGDLYMTGRNDYYQLGKGNTTTQRTFTKVFSNVKQVALGETWTLILDNDGNLWGVGRNNNGQLGVSSTTTIQTPVIVASNVKDVQAVNGEFGHGQSSSYYISTTGQLYSTGANGYHQLGLNNGSTADVRGWTLVSAVPAGTISSMNAKKSAFSYVSTDGHFYFVGYDIWGESGLGSQSTTVRQLTQNPYVSNVKQVFRSTTASFIQMNDGSLWAAGTNDANDLGFKCSGNTNETKFQNVADPICSSGSVTYKSTNMTNARGMAGGYYGNLALNEDGYLYGAGDPAYGFMGSASGYQRTFSAIDPQRVIADPTIELKNVFGDETTVNPSTVTVGPKQDDVSAGAPEVSAIWRIIDVDSGAIVKSGVQSLKTGAITLDVASYELPVGTYRFYVLRAATGVQSAAGEKVFTIEAPVITADSEVTYERGIIKDEAQFLSDIHASTDEGSPITSNFISAANLNAVGDYTITLNATNPSGVPAVPRTVTVHIVDTTAPVITADAEITYERGVIKTETEFLTDIHATLNEPGTISSNFVAQVSLNVSGNYIVTLTAVDTAGNAAVPATVIVHIEDTTPPVLTADTAITYERGIAKTEAEFLADIQATLNEPGTITSDFVSQVNMNTTGIYTVTVNGADSAGNPATPVTVQVTVEDTIAPIITANKEITLSQFSPISESDFFTAINASTDDGSPITSDFDSIVDFDVDGTYTVTLQAVDSSGNVATPVTVSVHIVNTTTPIINADTEYTYEKGSVVSEGDFLTNINARTNDGSIVTSNFAATVNLDVVNTYTVQLDASNANGAAEPLLVTVHVVDTTPPVLSADSTITYERGTAKTEEQFLTEVNATINEPGTITSDFATKVNMNVSGVYTVTILATDTAGNAATPVTVTVTIEDTTKPIIDARGIFSYERGTTRSEAEFLSDINATLNEPGTITSDFTTVVNLDVSGVYTVTLNATDLAGNTADPVIVTVTVEDTIKPIITATTPYTYERGVVRTEAEFLVDISAEINEPGTITSDFDTIVDLDVSGTYTVTLNATDLAGNQADPFTVEVIVEDTIAPVINNDPSFTYERGVTRTETEFLSDINASTDDGSPITSDFATAVNLNTVGEYTVILNAKDLAGNEATPVSVIVYVVDTTSPVLTADAMIQYTKGDIVDEATFLANVHAVLDEPGTISSDFDSAVDMTTIGVYTVTMSGLDTAGNASNIVTVQVVVKDDNTAIDTNNDEMIAAYPFTVEESELTSADFVALAQAKAWSLADGSDVAVTMSSPKPTTSGTFNITYTTAKGTSITIEVVVTDNVAPVITADAEITYERGISKTEAEFLTDINATLNEPGTITSDFVTIVQLNVAGDYTVTLNATDTENNPAAPVFVTVHVMDTINPILTADATITYTKGTVQTEAEFLSAVSASLNEPGTITSDFDSVADLGTSGVYAVTINGQDTVGNVANPVRVVVVVTDGENTIIDNGNNELIKAYPFTINLSNVAGADFIHLAQVKAWNLSDGSIVSATMVGTKPTAGGVFPVTFETVKGTSIAVDVTVIDDVSPTMTADEEIRYELGTVRSETEFLADIHAALDEPGTMTSDFATAADLDTVGVYFVSVYGYDTANNASNIVSVRVIVTDGQNTHINNGEMISAYPFTMNLSEVATADYVALANAKAWNLASGNEIAVNILTKPITAGDHVLTYTTDLGTIISVDVTVLDDVAPILTADSPITYERGITKTAAEFLTDVNAMLDEEGTITSDFDSVVNLDVSGTYNVTISGQDTAGNASNTVTVSVIVEDTTAPVLTANSPVIYERGTTKTEAEFFTDVSATLNEPGTISSNFAAVVQLDTAGVYNVNISGQDTAGNVSNTVTVRVIVTDDENTVIDNTNNEMISAYPFTVNESQLAATDFVAAANAKAWNLTDGNTVPVSLVGTKPTTSGVHAVTFTTAKGTEITVDVTVIDDVAPILTATNVISYEVGTAKTGTEFLNDISAILNEPGTISSDFETVVNLDTIGVYFVMVSGQDTAGNASNTVKVRVTITDSSNTIIDETNGEMIAAYPFTINLSQVAAADFVNLAQARGWSLVDGSDVAVNMTNAKPTVGGTYPVIFATSKGTTITVDITVVDDVAPIITASSAITYERGSNKLEAQFLVDVAATLNEPGTITSDFATVVNMDVSGTYTVTLNATDTAGNAATPVTVTVTIVDTGAPTLSADERVTYTLGTAKTEAQFLADVHAALDEPGTISSDFATVVDLNTAGVYNVTLNGVDNDNNASNSVVVRVLVTDDENTVIDNTNDEMIRAYPFTIHLSQVAAADFVALADAKAWDLESGSIVPVSMSGNKPAIGGVFVVTFETAKGTSITVNVTVIDDVAPILTADSVMSYEVNTTKTEAEFLSDIHAALNEPGTITSDFDPADLNTVGIYFVTVSGSDTAGNHANDIIVRVNVTDSENTVIDEANAEMIAAYPFTINLSDVAAADFVTLANARGWSLVDGSDVAVRLTSTKPTTGGTYPMTFATTKGTAITIDVTVVDNVPPVLTADVSFEYELGTSQADTGFLSDVNATLDEPGTISSNFETVVNLNVVGVYFVDISGQDSAGNASNVVSVRVAVLDGSNTIINPTNEELIAAYPFSIHLSAVASANFVDLASAQAWSLADGSDVAVTMTSAKPTVGGVHTVTFATTKGTSISVPVTVVDDVPPVLTADARIIYAKATVKDEAGFLVDVNAVLNESGTISSDFASVVDMNTAGVYVVTLSGQDTVGNASNQVSVRVVVTDGDNTKIDPSYDEMIRAYPFTVNLSDVAAADFVTLAQARGWSLVDGSNVAVSMTSTKPTAGGTYPVTFATSQGTSITVNVTVVDDVAPTLTADSSIAYEKGTVVSEAQFLADIHAVLDEPGTISSNIATVVDFNAVGVYTVTLSGADTAGNASNVVTAQVVITDSDNTVVDNNNNEMIAAYPFIINLSDVETADFVALAQAQAWNLADGSNVAVTMTSSKPTSGGSYDVTFASAKGTSITVRITVDDDIPPVISADSEYTYERTATITEAQFLTDINATTDDGSGVTSDFASVVDLNVVGDYIVTLQAMDISGNQATPVTVTVHVIDTTKPVITADASIIYVRGDMKDEAEFLTDIHAQLNEPGTITSDFDTAVDMNLSGTYTVILNATDTAGNVADPFTVTVRVQDDVPPVITVDPQIEYPLNTVKTDAEFLADVNAVLDEPGTITSDFETVVDSSVAGVYDVTVNAEDADGNQANPVHVLVLITDAPNTVIDTANQEFVKAYPFTINLGDVTSSNFVTLANAQAWDLNTGQPITITLASPKPTGAGTHSVTFATSKGTQITVEVTVQAADVFITLDTTAVQYLVNVIPTDQELIDAYGVNVELVYPNQRNARALPVNVVVSIDRSNIDYTRVGTYTITFTATDILSGNSASTDGEYIVYANPEPPVDTTDNNSTDNNSGLPSTGQNLIEVTGIGAGLVIIGGIIVGVKRRRRK